MNDQPTLTVVPEDADATKETEKQTFTFEELLTRNAGMVRELIDEFQLDHQAAVLLFGSTLQIHMQAVHARQYQQGDA